MAAVDIAFAIVLAYGFWQGWSKGFFCRLAVWAGVCLGFCAACMYCRQGADFLAGRTGWPGGVSYLAAFLLIWVAVAVAARLLGKLLTWLAECAGVNGFNRLTGALCGLLVYAMGVSCLIHAAEWGGLRRRTFCERSVLYVPLRSLVVYTYSGCEEMIRQAVRDGMKDIGHTLEVQAASEEEP